MFLVFTLTPFSRGPPEKPFIIQLAKRFPAFTKYEISLLCSQESATGPYPEPAESSTQPYKLLRQYKFY